MLSCEDSCDTLRRAHVPMINLPIAMNSVLVAGVLEATNIQLEDDDPFDAPIAPSVGLEAVA